MLVEERIGELLTKLEQTLAIAESLTGGLVTSMITDVPGSSAYLLEGIVAYANGSKVERLGVAEDTLIAHGAVSEAVACEMAEGVRSVLGADWGISTTGIAGPTGDTEDKPLGLVYYAVASDEGTVVRRAVLPGDRLEVKRASAKAVLSLLYDTLEGPV